MRLSPDEFNSVTFAIYLLLNQREAKLDGDALFNGDKYITDGIVAEMKTKPYTDYVKDITNGFDGNDMLCFEVTVKIEHASLYPQIKKDLLESAKKVFAG